MQRPVSGSSTIVVELKLRLPHHQTLMSLFLPEALEQFFFSIAVTGRSDGLLHDVKMLERQELESPRMSHDADDPRV